MKSDEKKVGPLKKVVVNIEAGISEDPKGADPLKFAFIYGIGAGGLCPLEVALADKREKDTTMLPMKKGEVTEFFGHLNPPAISLPDTLERFMMHITVTAISEADPREVIKAMAEAAECGDHCCGR